MTWVIGPLCIDKMDTACVEVCPVDCIHLYTGNDPAIPKNQLLIDPAECIDCAACEPACPWEAIYQDAEVPEEFKAPSTRHKRPPFQGEKGRAEGDAFLAYKEESSCQSSFA